MTTIKRRALLAADTDRTQQYVFESARLPEIRGASTILTDLNETASTELIASLDEHAECIYAGGGGLLYEVTAEKAPKIQRELEALYPQKTGVVTITCVYREIPTSVDEGVLALDVPAAHLSDLSTFQQRRWQEVNRDLDCFGAWVRLLGQDLRRRKQEKRYVPFVASPSHAERCQACRIRPASVLYSRYEDTLALCPECVLKNQDSSRFIWRDRFDKKLRTWYPMLAKRYFTVKEQGTIPMDLSVIASACAPRNHNKQNYVAFIYADGDGVGAFVESQRKRQDFEDMSRLLNDATWHAVTFALANNLSIQNLDNPMKSDETDAERMRPTQPFEIITVGGDDVMLIVPAHVALQIARDMAAEFRRFLDAASLEDVLIQEGERKLSLSVGVVIAPAHMPVRLMRDFAQDLLKEGAKPRAKRAKEAAVDFQIFTSTAIYGTDVMELRKTAPYAIMPPDVPQDPGKTKPLYLYHRPYTLRELNKLLAALQALSAANFPTSQLAQLAQALERGRRRATLFYLYQRSRLEADQRVALAQFETILPTNDKLDPVPWYKAQRREAQYAFSTPLRDVAELYDFIPDKEVSS